MRQVPLVGYSAQEALMKTVLNITWVALVVTPLIHDDVGIRNNESWQA